MFLERNKLVSSRHEIEDMDLKQSFIESMCIEKCKHTNTIKAAYDYQESFFVNGSKHVTRKGANQHGSL